MNKLQHLGQKPKARCGCDFFLFGGSGVGKRAAKECSLVFLMVLPRVRKNNAQCLSSSLLLKTMNKLGFWSNIRFTAKLSRKDTFPRDSLLSHAPPSPSSAPPTGGYIR